MNSLVARDPVVHQRPHRQRRAKQAKTKSYRSGIVASALAVCITLYSLGYIPQIDAFFTALHTYLQSRNDEIVAGILSAAPFVLIATALCGLALMVWSSLGAAKQKA